MSTEEIKSNVLLYARHYMYACFAKSWNAAIAAAYGVVGAAAGSAFMPDKIQTPNWEMAGSIFVTAFALTSLEWLKDNPIPERL